MRQAITAADVTASASSGDCTISRTVSTPQSFLGKNNISYIGLHEAATHVKSCVLNWSYWQFAIERLIETLPPPMRSHVRPFEALFTSISRKYEVELITAFGLTNAPSEWSRATGERFVRVAPAVASSPSPDGAKFALLSPRSSPAPLTAVELDSLVAASDGSVAEVGMAPFGLLRHHLAVLIVDSPKAYGFL